MATPEDQKRDRVVFVAVDGSDVSAQAFSTYVDVLRQEGDRVVLFTCTDLKDVLDSFWEEAVYTDDPDVLRVKLSKEQTEARARLQPLVDQLQRLGVQNKAVTVMAKDPGQVMLQRAGQEGASLIVIGCRGRGKLRQTLMGSCSDFVVNHSNIPVVVCRKN